MPRTKNKPNFLSRGPYEAIVVGHLDPKYGGALRVELLTKSSAGNEPEKSGQLVIAKYMSPFYGVTPQGLSTGGSGYQDSQKSYGMWMIPPDVGTKVIVILIEGNSSRAYWIGCAQDTYMNFMMPGYASTKQVASLTDDATGQIAKKMPVAEYNKNRETGVSNSPTQFLKPPHTDLAGVLQKQGLLEDDVRGTTSSSARREVPSSVFGISTPGPIDKRKNAPKQPVGSSDSKAINFVNRLGGSSFVMDDGDDKILRKGPASSTPPEYENLEALTETDLLKGDPTLPANELIRLRTRTGHQILLHNTEDLIYIGNARGTSWIEMTSNGKIDIYAQDSISMHTSADLNFTADRDINFTAGENVNLMVGKDLKTTTGDSVNFHAGLNINNTAGQAISEIAGTHISNFANLNSSYQSLKDTVISTGKNLEISAGSNINLESLYNTHLTAGYDTKIKTNTLNIDSGDMQLKCLDLYADAQSVNADFHRFTLAVDDEMNVASNIFALNTTETCEINSYGNLYSLVDGNIGIRADGNIKLQSVSNSIDIRAEQDIKHWAKTGNIESLAAENIESEAANGYLRLTAKTRLDISSRTEGVYMESGGGVNVKSNGGSVSLLSSNAVDIKSSSDAINIDSGSTVNIKASDSINVKGSSTNLQPPGNVASASSASASAKAELLPTNITTNPFIPYVKWHKYDDARAAVASVFMEDIPLMPINPVTPTPAVDAERTARVPMHEPWYQHENLDPLAYTPERTRAGSETPDAYNPEIPDTFATVPETQTTSKKNSRIFKGILDSDMPEYQWPSDLTSWFEKTDDYGITTELAVAVVAVVVSEYHEWNPSAREEKPEKPADLKEEEPNLLRRRFMNFRDKSDTDLIAVSNMSGAAFFEQAYGYFTEYGRAIGNNEPNDGFNFRGFGPYHGLVGRGVFEKYVTTLKYEKGMFLVNEPVTFDDWSADDRLQVFARFVGKMYKDHGRGLLGNVRIMLFGTQNYELNSYRDKYIYENNVGVYRNAN